MSFNKVDVEKKLQKLKPTKSAGPDGIHPRVLLEAATSISPALSALYSKSLQEGHMPTAWKEGLITPIHKKGDKSQPGNYRPISLTSVAGKVMESLIRDKLVNHMMDNNLFCDAQHSFVPGRSCMTQLLVTQETWSELIDKGEVFDAIYLDFK